MFKYILKRLFLMIPTLFAICLIIFVILNVAPGKPGSTMLYGEGTMQADQGKKREAYKIFKEQFNLDKPILLNFSILYDK
jgi:ABC-type dipeptide/oligopeptide/nickel transport system permease component